MNLNPGGIIGGLLAAGAGAYFVYLQARDGGRVRAKGPIVLGAMVGGFVGNAVWNVIFPGAKLTDADGDGVNDWTGEPTGGTSTGGKSTGGGAGTGRSDLQPLDPDQRDD